MKRQRLISKGSLSRLFQQAAEAWRRQAYQESIALLERASRLDPGNPSVLLDLGRAYGMRYDYPSAERCLDKAVHIAAHRAQTLTEAARRCYEFGNYEMASRYFERAANEQGAPPEPFVALAELHERKNRLPEAARLVERGLAVRANHPWSLLVQARLERLAGALEEAERHTRELLELPSCDAQTRIRAWYELGGILDRQQRYDDAMSAFLEAKALQRPAAAQAAGALQGVHARVKELEQTISRSILERWNAANANLGPPRRFGVLCGHPRSGTTLLEQVLDAHPEIVTAEETQIFHDEAYLPLSQGFPETSTILQVLEAAPPSRLRKSRDDYFRFTERFIGKSFQDKLLIDKNPVLSVLIPAVVRIFPEARFLVALRDPRDVCLSCFMQALPINPVSSAYLTLEGAATQYALVMGFWQALLPRVPNPFLEIRYEELVEDLESVARRTLDFLEVPWEPRVLRFDEHARTKPVRSPSYAEVTKPIFKSAIGRWRNYQKYLEPWLEKLDPFINAYGYE